MKLNTKLDSTKLDFTKIPAGYCYVLDASAVLRDAAIEDYRITYKHLRFKEPGIYILSTVSLAEVDRGKYTRDGQDNYYLLMERLRKWARIKKLSTGPLMKAGENNHILFFKGQIENIQRRELSWLHQSYGDRHILSLALELRKAKRKVAVVSRDSLMSVVCKELGIPHKFLEPYHSKSSPRTSAFPTTTGEPVTVNVASSSEKITVEKDKATSTKGN